VDSLPPGFSSTTLLSLHLHSSPTQALEEWGGVLQSYYRTRKEGGKEGGRAGGQALDRTRKERGREGGMEGRREEGREEVTKDYLSYYTDNGAYYYYLTEGNKVREGGREGGREGR